MGWICLRCGAENAFSHAHCRACGEHSSVLYRGLERVFTKLDSWGSRWRLECPFRSFPEIRQVVSRLNRIVARCIVVLLAICLLYGGFLCAYDGIRFYGDRMTEPLLDSVYEVREKCDLLLSGPGGGSVSDSDISLRHAAGKWNAMENELSAAIERENTASEDLARGLSAQNSSDHMEALQDALRDGGELSAEKGRLFSERFRQLRENGSLLDVFLLRR